MSTHANVWEGLQLHTVVKTVFFYYKSHENPYQVLQVTCVGLKVQ